MIKYVYHTRHVEQTAGKVMFELFDFLYVQMTSEWKTKATLKVFILVTESRRFSWLCFRAQKFQGGRTENQADGHCKTFWAVWDLKLIACCFICFLQSFSCRCFGIHWKCRKSANSLKSMLMSQGHVDAWFRCHELSGWDWDALGRLPAVASGWGGNDSCTRSCTRGATDSHRSRVAATQIKTFHWFFDIFCRLPKWSATQEMQGPHHFELGNFSSSFFHSTFHEALHQLTEGKKEEGKKMLTTQTWLCRTERQNEFAASCVPLIFCGFH